jgi:CAAX prenyl protease-like protein
MNPFTAPLTRSPLVARVAPFIIFLVLTLGQAWSGVAGAYWLYLVKTLLGAWMIWAVRPVVGEMRWKISVEAIAAGIAVFVMWVGLDELLIRLGFANSYPKLQLSGPSWNPHAAFGQGTALAWLFIIVRIAGSSLVVPALEEVFFRSFVYRYVIKADFLSVPLGVFNLRAFLITSVLFGFEHAHWLAGILCGFAYQGLVCWKKRLGDAMTAHAITNGLLGVWVVWKGAWHYW